MRIKSRLISVVFTFIILFMFTTTFAFADSGYTTDKFDVKVVATQSHVFHVKESITVNFKEARHGIYRYITMDLGKYRIDNLKVEGYEYSTETTSEGNGIYKMIKIGSGDETVTGSHTYNISYDVVAYEDPIEDADYLSLDLLPVNWETPIKSTSITMTMPSKIDWNQVHVYASVYGATGIDENVGYKYSGNTINVFGSDLGKGVGVTISSKLPEGYWVGAANHDFAKVPLAAILIVIPLLMAGLWLAFGRDPKLIKTVEFYSPDGISPAELGYIIDGKADAKDLTSMIVYFASKGYLTITEYEKNKFEFKKLKEIDSEEKRFASTLFDGIFADGDSVKQDVFPENFGDFYMASKDELVSMYGRSNSPFTNASKISRAVGMLLMFVPALAAVLLSAYVGLNYLLMLMAIPVGLLLIASMIIVLVAFDRKDSNKKSTTRGLLTIGTIMMVIGMMIATVVTFNMLGILFATGVVISMVVTYLCVLFMKARTPQSAKWQGRILGFKNFIESAEVDRLKLLVEENPKYFYDILPYAYVMGLSDKWIKNFEKINIDPPQWYYGYNNNMFFNLFFLNHMMTSCTTSIQSSAFHIDASDVGGGSIGGGFGGGGFSGGGFGGGGGGSW